MFILYAVSISSTLSLINMWVGDLFGIIAISAGGELNEKALKARTWVKYFLILITSVLWGITITI